MWNESVQKIIMNNTVNLLFKTAISILVISNHNSFRVSFDKIASVACILFEKCIYILASETASPGNQLGLRVSTDTDTPVVAIMISSNWTW